MVITQAALSPKEQFQPTPAPPKPVHAESGKPPLWMHLLAVVGVSLLTLYVSLGLWGWTYDDAFIIYRYARNFAEGAGMVYNLGEHYLGTSSIGYTLLLAGLHKAAPGVDFPLLGSLVSAAGLWAAGMLVWAIGVQTRTLLVGLPAALLTVANPMLVESWGGEMPLLLPLVLGAIFCYSRATSTRAYLLTGALIGAAVLTRQDSLVLVGLIVAHYLWKHRKLPLALMGAIFVVLLPWLLYSWAFFGSPVPGTLGAKVAQGKAGWPFFLSGSLNLFSDILGKGLARPLVLSLLPIGLATLLWDLYRRRKLEPWLLMLGWAALFTAGYTALRVAFYTWYAVPLSVGIGVLLVWGVVGVGRSLGWAITRGLKRAARNSPLGPAANGGTQRTARVAGMLLAFALLPAALLPMRDFDTSLIAGRPYHRIYDQAGQWLAEHGGPDTSVAYLEVGKIGYSSRARVIDLLGLVTPGAASQVPFSNYEWAVQRYQPNYYLAYPPFEALLQNLSDAEWFQQAYSPVAVLQDRESKRPDAPGMVIYRRNPDAVLPPPLRAVQVQRTSQQTDWVSPGADRMQQVGQTFTAPAPDLAALSLLIGIPTPVAQGSLVLHLRRGPEDGQDLRRVEVPLSQIANNAWLTFRFEPLANSAGQSYFAWVEVDGLPPGPPPLAAWYATDDLYPGGVRYRGDEPVVGDLCLRLLVPDSRP